MKKILILTISLLILGLPMGVWGRPMCEDGWLVYEGEWHCVCPAGKHEDEDADRCVEDDNGEEEQGEDPEPQQPQVQEATNVPALEHFTGTNTYTANELNFTFTPKGSVLFVLHVNLKSVNGRDVLSGWCTGDESVCKAVGNGKACSGEDYTGSNMWCYKAE